MRIDFWVKVCYGRTMIKTDKGYASNSFLASIMDEVIACERRERDAARRARESGAVFTDECSLPAFGYWMVSDRH